jgi:hypothetical protein
MNRGLLIVKLPTRTIYSTYFEGKKGPYIYTGVHWNSGAKLQKVLEDHFQPYRLAIALVMQGRMSQINAIEDWEGNPIEVPRPLYAYERGEFCPPEPATSIAKVIASFEHETVHVHEGTGWRMEET